MKSSNIRQQIEKGVISWGNGNWFAFIRPEGYFIEFVEGKYTFSKEGSIYRKYKNLNSFAIRVTQLTNRGY